MSATIAVLNAGSSSLKFSLFDIGADALELRQRGQISGLFSTARFEAVGPNDDQIASREWPENQRLDHAGALEFLIDHLHEQLGDRELAGVGHRVVHGGLPYSRPIRVDAAVLEALEELVPLAPLHQPHNLAPIRRWLEIEPGLPQVACFDTAFHRTNADLAQMFGLPYEMFESGVRRYGFHGSSYEYIASVLQRHDERAARGRTIVLHLGNGASMCALAAGRSVATTMGFTAVDGLVMGTRTGNLDPGVVLYLMDQRGMDARAIERLLYKESGLLGISGLSSDMRELRASEDPRARLAIDLFCYRIRRELGSLAAALDGLDAIVFTAGIGENAVSIRAQILRDAAWLGVEMDETANDSGGPVLTTPDSRVTALVIPTDEELMIAQHTRALLAG
ncbi:MAG TPA: acetate/propionate family kinase [Steroidobacteraceae bacterium]|nr:acetate/propionate family kinase [Steroidobacteraceae bacterium]